VEKQELSRKYFDLFSSNLKVINLPNLLKYPGGSSGLQVAESTFSNQAASAAGLPLPAGTNATLTPYTLN
jgi:hypothetical protein